MSRKKLTVNAMRTAANRLARCKSLHDLALLLEVPQKQLALFALNPLHYEFHVPKPSGGFRLIEAPEPELKRLLRKLNLYLQCTYYFTKTHVAFGYILNPKREGVPRNIITNAERHLGQPYMLNVDFDDFFHQLGIEQIMALFSRRPFSFTPATASTLASLCCYKGRLPMGNPTSPVLSNFALRLFDDEVWAWGIREQVTVTRFVDDLCVSAAKPITEVHFDALDDICRSHRLPIDPGKIRFFGKDDPKQVTGLAVGKGVDVPEVFYTSLDGEMARLKSTVEAGYMQYGHHRSSLVRDMKQQVFGMVNFVGMVRGYRDNRYLKYLNQYENAIDPDPMLLSVRWNRLPYDFYV